MALDTLQKICEDNAKDLNEATLDNDNTPVLDFIIPRLIPFNSNPISRLRVLAISATNHFVQLKSASILTNMTAYLESLFLIATDENTEVRQEVCRSFVMLLDNFTESLLPYLDQLIEYMIFCNQSQNTKVALEACDFWHQFSRLDSIHSHLVPFLPKVIPVILNSLIYTEEDLLMFGGGDEQEDLHPRFNSRFRSSRHHRQYESSDEDNDEEDDQEDDEFFSEWTLRKFSATSLEALTSTFKSQVTDILLPLLNHALFSQDWRVVESGILALGAAAEGGIDEISPHLPDMIPFLITNLSNTNAHVRYISCWTVSRFSGWIVGQCGNSEHGRTQFYEPVLRQLLKRILDRSRRVQEAACSAFSTLEEQATEQELVPYLPVILNHLTRALRLYRNKNLRLLYDTIGTLAESVGSSLNEPACIAVLMPPLISRWNGLQDTDSDLFPLLGCLTDIATSLGIGFLPFTEPVFTRCVMLVSTTLQSTVADDDYDDFDELDDEFIVVPLDLLSGIVQGLGNTVEPFVKQSTLLPLLAACAHYDSRYEVLQPTYALIGDLAKACFGALDPYLENIMPELIRQLENDDPAYKSVRNNAIWAIGEISIRWPKEKMEVYVEQILSSLIPLIHPQSQSIELQENAVNTIGRLGINTPEIAAHFLPHFNRAWLYRSRVMRENDEKDSAFQGFCKIVRLYPHALNEVAIRMLLDTIGQWQNPSEALKLLFEQVTSGYRGLLTEAQWNQVAPYLMNNNNNAPAVQ
ncbi:armadillo-type protein [Mucor mucedo]|uniref:armadillo-type protein n=1 Tax=Mucor mucedo TaxID=29922 RepID=UPI00221EDBE9|nr:armadillo-type protein [Mucor mucedo]KAI7892273.1 armadillo-type protein [Mucor mucedo]